MGHVVISGKELQQQKAIHGPKLLEAKVGGTATGELNFTVEYVPPSFDGKLEIEILNAQSLPNSDTFGKSDPFTIICLDNEEIFRTKTIENNLNPEWNEKFVCLISGNKSMVYITVWDEDVGSDDLLGTCSFHVKELVQQKTMNGVFELKKKNGQPGGQIHLSLKYTPPQLDGSITLKIKNAVGLANKDVNLFGRGFSDPYAIASLDGATVGKTKVIQDNLNPVWNEEFTFDVVPKNKNLQIHLFDDDLGDDKSLGFVRISAQEIIVRKSIEEELILRGDQSDLSITGKLAISLVYTPKPGVNESATIQQAARLLQQ